MLIIRLMTDVDDIADTGLLPRQVGLGRANEVCANVPAASSVGQQTHDAVDPRWCPWPSGSGWELAADHVWRPAAHLHHVQVCTRVLNGFIITNCVVNIVKPNNDRCLLHLKSVLMIFAYLYTIYVYLYVPVHVPMYCVKYQWVCVLCVKGWHDVVWLLLCHQYCVGQAQVWGWSGPFLGHEDRQDEQASAHQQHGKLPW